MFSAELPKRLKETQAGVKVGDFVLILVEPDDKWEFCMQAGQCVEVDEAAEKLRVHLFVNENNKIRGSCMVEPCKRLDVILQQTWQRLYSKNY